MTAGNFSSWTPELRAQLISVVAEQAQAQIEGDPELRLAVDWMVTSCGLLPSPELYRLVFLTSVVWHVREARS